MASQQIEEVPAQVAEQPVLHEIHDSESTEEIEPNLSQSQHSGSFNAQSHNVSTSQSIGDGQSETDDSNAPLSSRGSTRGTGEDGTMSNWGSDYHYITNRSRFIQPDADEDEKEEDGSPRLTNRFLFELFRKEWRKYYRTPELNEKLYLHYKGFSYITNMAQFTQLKCLYFEGNGCRSLTGLETNVELRSLFIQENVIEKIEGLDNLTELRQLNLSDNMIKTVTGLAGCTNLDTLYMKRNRLGKDECGDIETLKGLLERPNLTCLDISDNYLTDPEIVPEILMKLPNIKVLYLQGNDFIKKISAFRKTVIAKIPSLTYLDDRPVFPEDRRRAEAYARGGIEEERKEMRIIKKEKEDLHWANHEAFQLMINKAKKEKKEADEEVEKAKADKKMSMKEMMAQAKAEKAEQDRKNAIEGKFEIEKPTEEDKQFFEELAGKTETRFAEKQEGKEHSEEVGDVPSNHFGKERSDDFDRKVEEEHDKNVKSFESAVDGADKTSPEKLPVQEEEEEEDCPPDLEELDREELERTKQEKQQEWLNKVIAEESLRKQEEQAVTPQDDQVDLEKEEEENDTVDPEEILLDEKRVTEIQNEITKKDIQKFVGEQAEAVESTPLQEGYTEFDELD